MAPHTVHSVKRLAVFIHLGFGTKFTKRTIGTIKREEKISFLFSFDLVLFWRQKDTKRTKEFG